VHSENAVSGLAAIVAAFDVVVAAGTPEPASQSETVAVVPGARYQAGWVRRLLLGGQWRGAWNTKIDVPVLDLVTFDGGLTPDRQGGGNETFNLHFKSANGRTWVFRSVDKDPKKKFDPDTAQGWIGDLAQDLISGAHPGAPIVAGALAEAVGVLEAIPRFVVLPDDPRLGEFKRFAGTLGTFEERVERNVPGANKTEDTLALFARLDRHGDEHVDAREYLRVRLLDVFISDWDRHTDQYRWVRARDGDTSVWHVIPRDRDEAFSRWTGALPSLLAYYGKPIVDWGDTYPPIDKITFAGRYTDRRFLARVERPEWEEVTAEVVSKLTDSVISDAVRRLPAPLYAKTGEDLERTLRSRRDRLTQASKEFYALLADDVDVRASSQAEEFVVDRLPNGAVTVAVYGRDETSGERAVNPSFRRTFLADETSEIRLYTMGGKDRVIEQGNGTGAILLRVISPPGTSELVDRSNQASATKLYTPIPAPMPTKLQLAADPRAEERLRYEVFRDWGHDTLFYPQLSYDSTRGLLIGAYAQRTSYGFGLDPYASQMELGAAWSTTLNKPRIEYGTDFRTRSPVRVLLYAAYSGIEQAKFFGFGNEKLRDANLASNKFYDAQQDQVVVNPVVEVPLVGAFRARAGAEFKHAGSVEQTGRLIGTLTPTPSGIDGISIGSVQAGLAWDASNGTYPSQQKVAARVTVREAPAIFSNPAAFGKVRGEVAASYGGTLLTNVQLSEHVSGERNWGTYPFFEAAYLGGTPARSALDVTGATSGNLLRGYDLNRYAGDAAVVSNTELNIEVGRVATFLPLRYGLWGLFDVGRVFVDGESSSKWHTAAGGGVWFGVFASSPFFQLAGAVKAALVHTDEGTSFLLESGFGL
jgi:hypothetical protein